MGYTRDELRLCEGARIPDLLGDDCKLLFVGINPGLQTAMTGIHFAHPSNRFWPALERAGIVDWVPNLSPVAPSVMTDVHDQPWTAATGTHPGRPWSPLYPALREAGLIGWVIDTEVGMSDEQREDFMTRGLGITNLVARATPRASELTRDELRAGARRLTGLVAEVEPRAVAIAGVTAYRDAFGERSAALGRQPSGLAGADLWVVPNPSGLNAHETISSLARWYAKTADAAGIQ